jgi:hypothetical protein
MAELESERRWFHPRPDWLLIGLLAATGFLFFCDRFHWFSLGEKKGWARSSRRLPEFLDYFLSGSTSHFSRLVLTRAL